MHVGRAAGRSLAAVGLEHRQPLIRRRARAHRAGHTWRPGPRPLRRGPRDRRQQPDPVRHCRRHGVGDADNDEIYHLARRQFRPNGRRHELVLLRVLTAELQRQEVQTWKKVIRVISHEFNNSLAPIASLAHSGAELLRRGQLERLPTVLATIEDRARHLEGFIRDYARFAKLPAPRLESIQWSRVIAQLRIQVEFAFESRTFDGGAFDGSFADDPAGGAIALVDVPQLEQCLLNLLKNTHESGSAAQDVALVLRRMPDAWRVARRGARSRQRYERGGAGQRAAAVLLDQAQRHRPGPGARDRRSPRRPHRPAKPRGRRAVRLVDLAAVGAPHERDG